MSLHFVLEASFAVQARAVKDHFNLYDPQSLSFKEGDIIRVSFLYFSSSFIIVYFLLGPKMQDDYPCQAI